VKREEVDRRVKEDTETYSTKFSDDAKSCCVQVGSGGTGLFLHSHQGHIILWVATCLQNSATFRHLTFVRKN